MFVNSDADLCAATLVFFVLLVIFLEKRDQRREEHQSADDENGSAVCQETLPYHKAHPTDEEHRSAEQAQWRWQIKSEERKDRLSLANFSS